MAGVSELTTPAPSLIARDAEAIGVDALMVLPAMVYVPTRRRARGAFPHRRGGDRLPIMLYNNPPAYRVGDRN